jgi:hypothetical protein
LRGLDDDDLELRARLLARLAGAIRDEHSPEQRMALSQEAVTIARRLGDPRTLGYTLDARACMAAPDMTEQNLADATELVEVAEQAVTRSAPSSATSTAPSSSSSLAIPRRCESNST